MNGKILAVAVVFATLPAAASVPEVGPGAPAPAAESVPGDAAKEALLRAVTFPVEVTPGTRYICTGFWLAPDRSNIRAVAATAGHCWKDLQGSKEWWRDVMGFFNSGGVDAMLFWTASAPRYLPIAAREPERGETFYSLGMAGDGVRSLTVLEYVDSVSGFMRLRYVRGPRMAPGTSGSPVLNAAGEIAGISIGYNETVSPDLAQATDIRHLAPVLPAAIGSLSRP